MEDTSNKLGTDWKCQPIRVFRHSEVEEKPLLKRALSMDPGSPVIDSLQAELGKLRLFFCSAEETVAQAEEAVGRVDSLEAKVEELQNEVAKKEGEIAAERELAAKYSHNADKVKRELSSIQKENEELKREMERERETSSKLREVNAMVMTRLKALEGGPQEEQAFGHEMISLQERLCKAESELQRRVQDDEIMAMAHEDAEARSKREKEQALAALEKRLREEAKADLLSLEEQLKEENQTRMEALKRDSDASHGSRYGRDWISIKRDQFSTDAHTPTVRIRAVHGVPKSKEAHVVLVMRGDSYTLGASVVASRLKALGTKADVVCMVTHDVSFEARQAMASVFDVIYEVPFIEYACEKLTTRKQQAYYESWIGQSFTKWNALGLTAYKKVLLVDADLLPIENLDEIFKLKAPAATFSSPWSKSCKEDGYEDPYVGLKHGCQVPSQMIQRAVEYSLAHAGGGKGSYVALGSLVLLEPSLDTLFSLRGFIRSRQPFGVPGLHSGFDEQCLVLFFNLHCPHKPWMHIGQVWNSLAWHEKWLGGESAKAYHYFNEKPWTMSPAKYPDLKIWYKAAEEFRCKYSGARHLFDICLGSPRFLEELEGLEGCVQPSPRSSPEMEEKRQTPPLSGRKSWADLDEEEVAKGPHGGVSRNGRGGAAGRVIEIPRHRVWDQDHVNLRPQGQQRTPSSKAPVQRCGLEGRSLHNSHKERARSPERWTRVSGSRQGRNMDPLPRGFGGGHWKSVGDSSARSAQGSNEDRWTRPHDGSRGQYERSRRFSNDRAHADRW